MVKMLRGHLINVCVMCVCVCVCINTYMDMCFWFWNLFSYLFFDVEYLI